MQREERIKKAEFNKRREAYFHKETMKQIAAGEAGGGNSAAFCHAYHGLDTTRALSLAGSFRTFGGG